MPKLENGSFIIKLEPELELGKVRKNQSRAWILKSSTQTQTELEPLIRGLSSCSCLAKAYLDPYAQPVTDVLISIINLMSRIAHVKNNMS